MVEFPLKLYYKRNNFDIDIVKFLFLDYDFLRFS